MTRESANLDTQLSVPRARIDSIGPPYVIRLVARLDREGQLHGIVEPDDLAQEALGRFYRKLNQGQFAIVDELQLLGLLHKLVSDHLRDLRRRSRSHYKVTQAVLQIAKHDIGGLYSRETDPLHLLVYEETVHILELCLHPAEIDLLHLYSNGYSWKQIGQILGKRSTTVRKRLYRALQRLRTAFPESKLRPLES